MKHSQKQHAIPLPFFVEDSHVRATKKSMFMACLEVQLGLRYIITLFPPFSSQGWLNNTCKCKQQQSNSH